MLSTSFIARPHAARPLRGPDGSDCGRARLMKVASLDPMDATEDDQQQTEFQFPDENN
jgi:hypothetical protein